MLPSFDISVLHQQGLDFLVAQLVDAREEIERPFGCGNHGLESALVDDGPGAIRVTLPKVRGEVGHRRRFEERDYRDGLAHVPPQPVQERRGLDRAAAEGEEAVVPSHSLHSKHLAPGRGELFLEGVLRRRYPDVPVTTKLLTGGTESVLYRGAGLVAYGFTPLLPLREEAGTEHGDDERINEASVRESTGVFYEVVRELAKRR